MEKDMTTGSPGKMLMAFTLPMLLGNVFQQLYNIADTIIVGQCLGADALAAVGSSASMVFLILCMAIGLSMGCSVLISQFFGAGNLARMRQAVYISMVFILGVGLCFSVGLNLMSAPLLHLIRTPEEIFEAANTYITIYYWGCLFIFAYNALAAICRAIGDSKTPLYFLIVTSVLNIVLDLYFIKALGMGVAGAAWATTISQGISAVGCAIYVYKRVSLLRLHREDCVFDGGLLKDLIRYAIPSTIQQCIVSFSMMAVQGLVNGFGTVTIAGYTAATKIDSFAIAPLLSLNMALSTYTAQNMGAGKIHRVKTGLHVALGIMAVMCVIISGLIVLFGGSLIGLFVDSAQSADVIAAGVSYISVVSLCYIIMGTMFLYASVLRGSGDVVAFTIGSLLNFVIRIITAYSLAGVLGFRALAWSIPIGWACGAAFNIIRYKTGIWQQKATIVKA